VEQGYDLSSRSKVLCLKSSKVGFNSTKKVFLLKSIKSNFRMTRIILKKKQKSWPKLAFWVKCDLKVLTKRSDLNSLIVCGRKTYNKMLTLWKRFSKNSTKTVIKSPKIQQQEKVLKVRDFLWSVSVWVWSWPLNRQLQDEQNNFEEGKNKDLDYKSIFLVEI